MNSVAALLSEAWVQRLGWMLVHFLWQGMGIALLLAALLRLLTRASSHARYLVIGSALLLCAAMPVATWIILGSPMQPSRLPAAVLTVTDVPKIEAPLSLGTNFRPDAAFASPDKFQINWQDQLSRTANAALPCVVSLWFVGVLILTVRLALVWTLMRRFCLSGLPIQDARCLERFRGLVERMQISVPVQVLQSALVEVPTLIGWLRPTILVPASVFMGLTPDQLEAVLAHELAHVRRYDYLANLFQTVIETVLFYHPAVWWISRKLRDERENCCDDIALGVTQNRLVYASALAQLEERRALPLALTVSGGSLLHRIRRIAGANDRKAPAWPALAFLLGILGIVCLTELKAAVPTASTDNSQLLTPTLNANARSPGSSTVSEATPEQKAFTSALNKVRLDGIRNLPLDQFIEQIPALLKKNDPQHLATIKINVTKFGDEPWINIDAKDIPATHLGYLFYRLKLIYPLNYLIRDDHIDVWQLSQAEAAFHQKAKATQIDVDFNGANASAALKTIADASAAKGFAFPIVRLDELQKSEAQKVNPVTIHAKQIDVEAALRAVCYLGSIAGKPTQQAIGFDVRREDLEAAKSATEIRMGLELIDRDAADASGITQLLANVSAELKHVHGLSGPSVTGPAYPWTYQGKTCQPGAFLGVPAQPGWDIGYLTKGHITMIDKTHIQINCTIDIQGAGGKSLGKISGQWTQLSGVVQLFPGGQPMIVTLPDANHARKALVILAESILVDEDGNPLLPSPDNIQDVSLAAAPSDSVFPYQPDNESSMRMGPGTLMLTASATRQVNGTLNNAATTSSTPASSSTPKNGDIQPIIDAVKNDDAAALAKLVQGVNVGQIRDGDEPVLFAAHGSEVVKILLDHGADANERDKLGNLPLGYLCLNAGKNASAIAEALLDHGADVNALSPASGKPPLFDVCDGATADVLLKHGANVRAVWNGNSVMMMAGWSDPSVFEALLRNGVPFDLHADGPTVLLQATLVRNLPLMTDLLARGVDPNAPGIRDNAHREYERSDPLYVMTPLSAATMSDGELSDAAQLLLDHGAKSDDVMVDGLYNKRKEMIKALWSRGTRAISPLCYAVSQRVPVSDLSKLLDEGSPVDPPQDKTLTPLAEAALTGNMEAVQLLVARGASVAKDSNSNPSHAMDSFQPLDMAAREGHDEIVAYLLSHSASATPSALWQAARYSSPWFGPSHENYEKAVRLLIDGGALKRATPDEVGEIVAAPILTMEGRPNATVLKMLLDAGASPNAPAPRFGIENEKPATVVEYFRDYCAKYKDDPRYHADQLKPLLDLLEAKVGGKSTDATMAEPPKANPALDQALVAAARQENLLDVNRLLQQGADPNASLGPDETTALLAAVVNNHIDVVKALLDAGANPNLYKDVDTPLIHAADAETVRLLVQHGANVKPKLRDGISLLGFAVGRDQNDRSDVIAELIRQGADFSPNGNGPELLIEAAEYGKINIVRLLLDAGVSPDAFSKNFYQRKSALVAATLSPTPDVLKLLLARGAHPDKAEGYTSPLGAAVDAAQWNNVVVLRQAGESDVGILSDACARGDLAKATQLINTGANVNETDKGGQTPLLFAVRRGHPQIARLLLQHGANVNQFSAVGQTPYGEFRDLTNRMYLPGTMPAWDIPTDEANRRIADFNALFKEYPPEPNYRDASGRTALDRLAQEGDGVQIDDLLELKPDVNLADHQGNTALLYAARSPVVLMLDTAQIEYEKDGKTPAKEWNAEAYIVHTLINAGARLDLKMQDGRTIGEHAMFAAVEAKNPQVISVLHDAGVNSTDLQGRNFFAPIPVGPGRGI